MSTEIRPPYVVFERRAVEDRDETLSKGYYVPRDVDFVIITPPGGKSTIIKPVAEWFAQIRRQAVEDSGRFPPAWVSHFEAMYDGWKKGEELPLLGTPIKTWPVLTPAQREQCLRASIVTVEDLANAPEEALGVMGMGARALKSRAADWLKARGEGAGALSGEMEKLRQENENLRSRIKVLELRAAEAAKGSGK